MLASLLLTFGAAFGAELFPPFFPCFPRAMVVCVEAAARLSKVPTLSASNDLRELKPYAGDRDWETIFSETNHIVNKQESLDRQMTCHIYALPLAVGSL